MGPGVVVRVWVDVTVVDAAVVVVEPPRTNPPVEAADAMVVVGIEIVPVQTAPVGQQAT